jgi:hypothetical protein
MIQLLILLAWAMLALGKYPPPAPPFIPARHTTPGSNFPILRIVCHSTVSPCVPGGARNIARYFQGTAAGGSAHYIVDPGETIQSVGDSKIAWHAPPNKGSIGIEHCDMPTLSLRRFFPRGIVPKGTLEGAVPADVADPNGGTHDHRAAGSRNPLRWMMPNYRRMFRRSARLAAELCLAYDVPPYWRGYRALRAGARGLTDHNQVSKAFGQSSHWDMGAWPRKAWCKRVRLEIEAIEERARDAERRAKENDPR